MDRVGGEGIDWECTEYELYDLVKGGREWRWVWSVGHYPTSLAGVDGLLYLLTLRSQ